MKIAGNATIERKIEAGENCPLGQALAIVVGTSPLLPRHIPYADRHPFQGIIAGAGIRIAIATMRRLAATARIHVIISATGTAIAGIAASAAGIHALAGIAGGRAARRCAVPTGLVHIVHFDLQRM